MNGFAAVFKKELTQMVRDKTTLMFALMVPVFDERSTASPAELLTVVLPKLAAMAVEDIRRPMPALF